MAKETEDLALDGETCRKGVLAVFDDAAKGRYFVAEAGGRTVASLLVTSEWSDWRNGTVWWIQSVYVVPELRGRKVYSGLYAHVKGLAQSDPAVRGLRLYVEKKNLSAQKVYAALGMSAEHYDLYEWMKTF
jgi:GNAT superfamily N-acetyltransferase